MGSSRNAPDLPPEPPAKDDPVAQEKAGKMRAQLKARKGRESTILTRGVLTGGNADEASTSTLLGGGTDAR